MNEAYIVSTARTPIGKLGGRLKECSPVDLGAHAMKAALARAGLPGEALDLTIFGNVLSAGHGQLILRQAALVAGIPATVDGYALDMVCSSGMMAVMNAATMIKAGEAELVLAGGIESMSQAAVLLPRQPGGSPMNRLSGSAPGYNSLTYDGLTDPITEDGMGSEAERLGAEYGVTRTELDAVAAESHRRAQAATAVGLFAGEIAALEVRASDGVQLIEADEGIRPDTTPEILAGLDPVFRDDGKITAGNASKISDGAAALLVASEEALKRYNLTPMGRILGGTWSAGETWRFVEAPVPAVRKLLTKLELTIDDIDLFENNEAFAASSVLFHRLLDIPYEKLNIWGGAIALGHPIGCSGARIIVTLMNALTATGGRTGIASLCHGTGGATALGIERV